MSALSNVTSVSLDRFDASAVLAGLRLLGASEFLPAPIVDIMTDGGSHAPLSLVQIDELCERINTGEAQS